MAPLRLFCSCPSSVGSFASAHGASLLVFFRVVRKISSPQLIIYIYINLAWLAMIASVLFVSVLLFLSGESFVPHSSKRPCFKESILWAKSGKKKKKPKDGTISVNRVAYRNYEIVGESTDVPFSHCAY